MGRWIGKKTVQLSIAVCPNGQPSSSCIGRQLDLAFAATPLSRPLLFELIYLGITMRLLECLNLNLK